MTNCFRPPPDPVFEFEFEFEFQVLEGPLGFLWLFFF